MKADCYLEVSKVFTPGKKYIHKQHMNSVGYF